MFWCVTLSLFQFFKGNNLRTYGSVQTCFWQGSDTQKLSDQGKLLAIYLLTGPHSNMLGCLRLPSGYIKEDLKWSSEGVKNAFCELSSIGFLTRDEDSGWLVIHHFLRWNPIQNPGQAIAVEKIFNLVSDQSTVFKPLLNSLLTYGKFLKDSFTDRLIVLKNTLDTVSEDCATDKEQNQDQEQDQEQKSQSLSSSQNTHIKHPAESQSLRPQAQEILQFLNEKAGRAFQSDDINMKLIMSRLKTGATVTDCKQVIARKVREWKNNADMAKYLRPATLFNATKFSQYRGELVLPTQEGNADESH